LNYRTQFPPSICLIEFDDEEPSLKSVHKDVSALKVGVRRPHTAERSFAPDGVVLGMYYTGKKASQNVSSRKRKERTVEERSLEETGASRVLGNTGGIDDAQPAFVVALVDETVL
jgi:hypothetical protein